MKYIFFIMALFFMVGCQNAQLPIQSEHNQSIAKTKKQEITHDGRRFLIVATYINDIEHKNNPKDEYEHFIISFYEAGENPYKKPILGAKVDGKDADWKFVNIDNPLVNMVSTTNSWSQYYHVKAPKSESNTLKLEVVIDENRNAALDRKSVV